MKKDKYKIIKLSTLITILTSSNLIPINVFAKEAIEKKIQVNNVAYDNKYSLSPQGMEEALQSTRSNSLVMNIYAKAIRIQPEISFMGMTFKNRQEEERTEEIIKNTNQAKINAKNWLEQEQPFLIKTTQNIADFSMEFNSYASDLEKALNKKDSPDKEVIKEVLQILISKIEKRQKEVTRQVQRLADFKGKLVVDNSKFKNNATEIMDWMTAQDGQLKRFKDQMSRLESDKESLIADKHLLLYGGAALALVGTVVSGGLAIALTFGAATPVVLPMMVLSTAGIVSGLGAIGFVGLYQNPAIQNVNNEMEKLKIDMSTAKTTHETLRMVGKLLTGMEEITDYAKEPLEALRTQYIKMQGRFQNLFDSVDDLSTADIIILKEVLEIAKKDHESLSRAAEKISGDLSFIPNDKS